MILTRLRSVIARTPVIVALIVAGGAILRMVGLTWGLPQQLNPDEWVIVQGALDLAARNSFEPSIFLRPDHLEIQLSFLAYTAYSWVFTGGPVEVAYAADPGMFLLISRLITSLFGTGMIVLAFLIGRRFDRSVGIIAAVLFAIYPPFVFHSHLATPDVPLTTVLMGLVLACMYYLAKPGYVSLLIASATVSLAIAIKYPGAIAASFIALVVVIMAVRERKPWRIASHGLVAIAGVVGFLFAISPVLFTNVSGVVAAIQRESRTNHPGADGLGFGGNLAFYATEFVLSAGIIVTVAAIAGVVFSIRDRSLQAVPLALGAFMWVALSVLPLHWERWGVPMVTSPLLFAAIGAWLLPKWVAQRGWLERSRRPLAIGLASLAGVSLLLGSIAVTARYLAPDTRVSGAETLAQAGVTGDNTIFEGYSPFVPSGPLYVFDEFTIEGDELVAIDDDKQYLLLSSCVNGRFEQGAANQSERDFYEMALAQFEPVLEIPAVAPAARSPFEPLAIVGASVEIAQLASGASAGCTIEVLRL